MTHTYALLTISKAAFNEIGERMFAAGGDHAFKKDSEGNVVLIDMHGIALTSDVHEIKESQRIDYVIAWIEAHKEDQFSFVGLQRAVPGRRATLYTILYRLRTLGFVDRTDKAFATKLWWATNKWRQTSVQQVKAAYENYMIVRRNTTGELR